MVQELLSMHLLYITVSRPCKPKQTRETPTKHTAKPVFPTLQASMLTL